jgi:2-polyprenyl-6-methoxyphenol hydroxylase-like FAD-dependent oxidoreductase
MRLEGSTDLELGNVDLAYIKETYGLPHMVGHRHSLANGLFNGCKKYPSINFNFSTTVQKIHGFSPRPSFTAIHREGRSYEVECDVLLACDGIKSSVRGAMLEELGISASVIDSDQAAYRILLTREQMEDDPELLEYVYPSHMSIRRLLPNIFFAVGCLCRSISGTSEENSELEMTIVVWLQLAYPFSNDRHFTLSRVQY